MVHSSSGSGLVSGGRAGSGQKVVVVAGARPNFMKVKPVLDALEQRDVDAVLVHTGQHYDAAMSDVFFDELGLRRPDRHLGVGSGSHATQTARVMVAFERVIDDVGPDVVIVVGDVNSTLGCALVTAKSPARLAHVEAGLRSRDRTMPEEINRVVTDSVSDVLLAPSPDAVDNLVAEGVDDADIHLVGNVMIDTLLANLPRAAGRSVLADLGLRPGGFALATLHRPSTVDEPAVLAGVLGALRTTASRLPVVLPAHPRVRCYLDRLDGRRHAHEIRVVEPLGYLDFIALESNAAVVITDSGGVQEETTVLGVPCVTVRDTTERPITVVEGTNRVVGRDPERIAAAVEAALNGEVPARRPSLWDGRAAERIARIVAP